MIPLKDNITSRKIPIINYLFITLNLIVFIYELKLSAFDLLPVFITEWGVVPVRLINDFFNQFKTIFTSLFLHGGWLHFTGNMLYLYIFGDNVEDKLGHIQYIFFYLFCGMFSILIQTLFSLNSEVPMIGASGAIAGVMGAYFLLFPRAKILTLLFFGFFVRIVPIPSFFYLGFWFFIQAWSGALSLATIPSSHNIGGIAFWAHISGFVFGAVWVLVINRNRRRRYW